MYYTCMCDNILPSMCWTHIHVMSHTVYVLSSRNHREQYECACMFDFCMKSACMAAYKITTKSSGE